MIQMLRGQDLTRRRSAHDLHISLPRHVSTFWRVLKASVAFASGTQIVVKDGRTTRFWLDYQVSNDTLAFKYPNLFALARDLSTTVISQTCPLEGNLIWAPDFRRWPNQFMGANLYDDLNSLLALLQPKHLSTLPDVRQWKLIQGGLFTINFLYQKLTEYGEETNCLLWIWTTKAPPKTKIHVVLIS